MTATAARHAATRGVPVRVDVAVVLLGTLYCLAGSWHVSFWKDEADTLSAAGRSVPELFALLGNLDAVHGAYYLLLHGWLELAGRSEVAVRLPSAVAIGLAALGVRVLVSRLGGAPAVALLAAALSVVLPRASWAGIEARPFALTVALAAWATAVLTGRLDGRRGVGGWVLYIVLLGLCVIVNVFTALLVLAHGVALLASPAGRRLFARWFAAAAAATVLASPVLLVAARQTGQLGDNPIPTAAIPRNVVVNQWFLGGTPTPLTDPPATGSGTWAVAAVVLAGLAWVVVAGTVLAAVRSWRRGERDEAVVCAVGWALPWLLVPTAVIVGYAALTGALYNPRYFTFCAPALAVLLAFGIARVRLRWVRAGLVAALVAAALPVWWSQRTEFGKSGGDYSPAAAFIAAGRGTGAEGVYYSPRRPSTDGGPGYTVRYLNASDPAAMAGLRDLTITTTPAADGSLNGRSTDLRTGLPAADGLDVLWVVRRTDFPAWAAAEEDALLADAGWSPQPGSWRGPTTVVTHYVHL